MASHLRSLRSGSHLAVDTHAALPLILEHILTYPDAYRIITGRNKKRKAGRKDLTEDAADIIDLATDATSSAPPTFIAPGRISGAREPTVKASDIQADERLRKAGNRNSFGEPLARNITMSPSSRPLLTKIDTSPSTSYKLPPTYLMDFVRGVFTEDLCLVDFTQALTALGYLKDMETRRRKEMTEALERLGIHPTTLDAQKETLKRERPSVAEWVAGIVTKAKRIESLYTQVYIGLRRWTLINEMRLEPFNKSNCISMLNTLYPATYSTPVTSQLTSTLLNSQRNAFFRYILAVESNGKSVLQKLEQQGKRPADANAWPIVRDIVDKYLRTANNLIQDCTSVICEEDITLNSAVEKRTDSGVSFASSKSAGTLAGSDIHPAHRRPSVTQESYLEVPKTPSTTRSPTHHRKNSSNADIPIVRADTLRHKEVRKVGSTLERLARELKRMRSRSNDGRGDELNGDRPHSRSRGPSDASYSSGLSGDSTGDPFTIGAVRLPPPPMTATAANFPDLLRDEDDHIMPLPTQTRPRGLKKMKSASSITTSGAISRENAIGNLKQGLSMERKGSGQGQLGTIQLHNASPAERKFSVPDASSNCQYRDLEEHRRTLIARARAEKESMGPLGPHPSERSRSPLEERVGAFLAHGSPVKSSIDDMALDLMADVPIRKSSPKNKLRDFYGFPNVEVHTAKY